MDMIKILIVEDTILARKLAKMTLIGLGYYVDTAETGQEALKLFKENTYDLVFMDIGLPDMSGIDVAKSIRKTEQQSHLPIIALTAHCDQYSIPSSTEAPLLDDIIIKPLTQENAKMIVDKYVKSIHENENYYCIKNQVIT